MTVEVLYPHDAGLDRWREIFESLPRQDIHFDPGYARVQEAAPGLAVMVVWTGHGLMHAQPFYLGVTQIDREWCHDVRNLYGYGGAVPCATAAGMDAVAEWARANGVVSEFCVTHPLLQNRPDIPTDYLKEIVCIPLRVTDPESTWRRDRLAGVRKALEAGVHASQVEATQENISIFVDLYRATMARQEAAEHWNFPERYFHRHFEEMPGAAKLFFCWTPDDQVESAAIVLRGGDGTAYYHFAGNALRDRKARASDVMIHEVMWWAKRDGCGVLHLGGGVTSAYDDRLLVYKREFSQTTLPIYCYFRVFDQERYDALCRAKLVKEKQQGGVFAENFRPLYRRPAVLPPPSN